VEDDVMADDATKVIYVRAEESLHRTLKISAAVSGISLQDLVLEILRAHVQQEGQAVGGTITFVPVPQEAKAPNT
jgi:plasmid stability protein